MKIFSRRSRVKHAFGTTDLEELMRLAGEEAARRGHGFIGTEHMLLAVLSIPGGGREVVRSLQVDPGRIRRMLEREMSGPAPSRQGGVSLTARAKRALQAAVNEARGAAPHTEHVLVGLLCEKNGIAAQVLARLGVTLKQTRPLAAAWARRRI